MSAYPMPPDLQELVAKFGGYHNITDEAWREYDAAVAAWELDRRWYTAGRIIDEERPGNPIEIYRRLQGRFE